MPFCQNCGATLPDSDARYCPRCGAPVMSAAARSEPDQQTFNVSQRPKLIVRVSTPGSVTITNGPDGQVTVRAEIVDRSSIEYRAVQEGNTISVSSRTKTWDPFIWGSYVFSGGPRTNITIASPKDADLQVETVTDPISIAGINGNVSCESKTGHVRLTDCAGTTSVHTHTGNVELQNVNGLVDVGNTIGAVNFTGSLAAGSNSIRTTTGDIDVALKGPQDLSIEANTVVGHIISRLDLAQSKYDRGQYIGQHISGRIGSGRGRLNLEATTGSISIVSI
jgi:DUF4097 and DUF4098 domain-containing protein YvlB